MCPSDLSVFHGNWSRADVNDPRCMPGEALKSISPVHPQRSTLKGEECELQVPILTPPTTHVSWTQYSAFRTLSYFPLGCSSKNINAITHDKQSGPCKVITQSCLSERNSLICCYRGHQTCICTFSHPFLWTRWGIGLYIKPQFFSSSVQTQTH